MNGTPMKNWLETEKWFHNQLLRYLSFMSWVMDKKLAKKMGKDYSRKISRKLKEDDVRCPGMYFKEIEVSKGPTQ